MDKPIKFADQALEDTLDIYDHLEEFKEGLGMRFYEKLATIYDQIKRGNASYQALDKDGHKRRAFLKLTKGLHYRIIYEILAEYIEIQAVRSTWRK